MATGCFWRTWTSRGQLRGGFDHSPDNDDLANALVGSTALDSIESPTPHGAVSRVTSCCRSTGGQVDRSGSVNNRKGIGDGGGDDRGGRVGERGAVPVSYTHLRAHETDSYLVC